jgi:ligand-binding SRPBCC domain-containing protein
MPLIVLETDIRAPRARCFDLARSVDAHLASTHQTGERVVAGRTQGLLELGEEVTWEGVHLGLRQRLTAKVTMLEPPGRFVDVMVKGAFAAFTHTHLFDEVAPGTTRMTDRFDYRSPLGPLGRLADALFLERHMTRFLRERAGVLKELAERP